MTTRTYTQKDGTIWEWEETPAASKLIKAIHATTKESNETENQSN
jgi:hypothetical protein